MFGRTMPGADWFDSNAPATPPAGTPAPTGTDPSAPAPAQDFGNLQDPNQWMALVGDQPKLRSWVKAQNPQWPDQLVDYYVGVIQKQPGANPTEQAGSAQYYINDKFKKDPFYAGAQGIGLGGFGSLATGWNDKFQAPSVDEIRGMPGYQFALDEGIKSLDRMAAAKGTLNNGGRQKEVLKYATGLLDQTAQQKYQNNLGEYMQEYNIFRNNQNDVFDRYDRLAQRGTNAAGAATS